MTLEKYRKSQTAVRRLRQGIFDVPDEKAEQAGRVFSYLIRRYLRDRRDERKGQYSGLTHRELAATGTCETDWY